MLLHALLAEIWIEQSGILRPVFTAIFMREGPLFFPLLLRPLVILEEIHLCFLSFGVISLSENVLHVLEKLATPEILVHVRRSLVPISRVFMRLILLQ